MPKYDVLLGKLRDSDTTTVVTGGLNPRGAYDGGTAYVKGDSVDYNGSSYICILLSTGNLPTNTTYWQVLANKGNTGATGSAGYTPVKGIDYFDGAKGDTGSPGTTDYNALSNKPTIPTTLSQLSDDSTHRLVTDTQIGYWNGIVPIGGIIMWSGTIATIPINWALCDGTSNAPGPDLRNQFIVGASADNSGVAKTNLTGSLTQTGGSISHHHADHTLSTNVAIFSSFRSCCFFSHYHPTCGI